MRRLAQQEIYMNDNDTELDAVVVGNLHASITQSASPLEDDAPRHGDKIVHKRERNGWCQMWLDKMTGQLQRSEG